MIAGRELLDVRSCCCEGSVASARCRRALNDVKWDDFGTLGYEDASGRHVDAFRRSGSPRSTGISTSLTGTDDFCHL